MTYVQGERRILTTFYLAVSRYYLLLGKSFCISRIAQSISFILFLGVKILYTVKLKFERTLPNCFFHKIAPHSAILRVPKEKLPEQHGCTYSRLWTSYFFIVRTPDLTSHTFSATELCYFLNLCPMDLKVLGRSSGHTKLEPLHI